MYLLRYDFNQLEKAAEFIFNHNQVCSRWPTPAFSAYDVRIQIEAMMRRVAKQNMSGPPKKRDKNWTMWTGTGGFLLTFTSDDDESIDVEIYVDPAISDSNFRHTTEVVDF